MVDELAKYYALPSVSLRDVVWHRMKANATFHGLTLQQLYYDRIHPSNLGHTVLALALAHLVKHAALLAAAQPTAAAAAAAVPAAATAIAAAAETAPRGCAAAPAQLLSPMDSSVDPASTALECFAGDLLDRLVDKPRCHGWEMVVERSAAGLPKPGWIATQPGALTASPSSPPFTTLHDPSLHHIALYYTLHDPPLRHRPLPHPSRPSSSPSPSRPLALTLTI